MMGVIVNFYPFVPPTTDQQLMSAIVDQHGDLMRVGGVDVDDKP